MNTYNHNGVPPEVCLDKCKCGFEGKFDEQYYDAIYYHRAGCPKCGYATEYYTKQYMAMVEWNKHQRCI